MTMQIERTRQSDNKRRSPWARVGLLLVLLAVVTGCAHEQAYKRGEKLSREGEYENAIEELEKAVALAEEGHNEKATQRYREKLAAVKQEAGRYYHHLAEERFQEADLGSAQMLIERCVTYCPEEQPYWVFRQRVHKAIADAEQLRSEALALAQERQWKAALERMNDALRMYKTLPAGRGDLDQIKMRAYQYHLARAQDALQADDLDAAQVEAQAAVSYLDTGRDAKAVLQTVADRREAMSLMARGRTLLEQGNGEEALAILERAHRLHSTHAELSALLEQARQAVCRQWIEQGRRAMEAGGYPEALRLFRRCRGLLAGYGAVDALIADVQSRLADAHLELSREYAGNGIHGCAALHAAAALAYQPTNAEARRQLGQCAGQVQQDVRYTIAFAGFKAVSKYYGMADALGSAALQHLTRSRPANVVLVERGDLQIDPAGDLKAWDAVAGPQSPTALEGIDAVLVGQVLDAKVTMETKHTGDGESVYQDGFRAEPNPEHVHAAAELDAALEHLELARRRLAEAEARLARYDHIDPANTQEQARKRQARADVDEGRQRLANAAATVGTAQVRVAATPREVLVPNMVKHRYPIQTATSTARVACMLKMLDTATGELILAERLEGVHARSDRFVAGDPGRNVPEDPLELAGEPELLDEAVKAAVGELKRVLDGACRKHGQRFVVRAERAGAVGDVAQAADNAVKYLFAYPAGHDQTGSMSDAARQYLGEEADLIDAREPLRTHCQVVMK